MPGRWLLVPDGWPVRATRQGRQAEDCRAPDGRAGTPRAAHPSLRWASLQPRARGDGRGALEGANHRMKPQRECAWCWGRPAAAAQEQSPSCGRPCERLAQTVLVSLTPDISLQGEEPQRQGLQRPELAGRCAPEPVHPRRAPHGAWGLRTRNPSKGTFPTLLPQVLRQDCLFQPNSFGKR